MPRPANAVISSTAQGRIPHAARRRRRSLILSSVVAALVAVPFVMSSVSGVAGTVVKPSAMNGWTVSTSSTTTVTFEAGPATAPLGNGSVELSVGSDGNAAAQVRLPSLAGTDLDTLTALTYSAYVDEDGSGGQAPYIIMAVDHDNDTNTGNDLLFFEPVYQTAAFFPSNPQPAIVLDTWQSWDALNGGWWSLNGFAGANPGTGVKSIAHYLTIHPDAKIGVSTGAFRFVAGFGAGAWDDFIGNVDNFSIATNTPSSALYDFEPETACTTDCYVNDATGDDGFGGDSPSSAKKTIQAGIDAVDAGGTVHVAAGTYDEQVVIDGKSLTLDGAGATTIIRPSSASVLTSVYTTGTQTGANFNGATIASIIDVRNVGTAGVTIRDLTVDGENVTATPAGVGAASGSGLSGILFGETGGLISNVRVEDTGNIVPASVRSYSVWLDAVANTAVSVDVTDSTAFHYGRNGLNARGDDLTVDFTDNTITGPGTVGPSQVPNGVLLIAGAGGTVTGNTITANHYTGSSFLGSGVLLFQAADGVEVSDNDISDTDDAVLLNATDLATVEDNDLSGNVKGVRIEAGSAANNTIAGNTVNGNSLVGIELSDTVGTGNTANRNSIAGNTAGVSNLSTNPFDAECNWWGASSGPAGVGTGSGDTVSATVDFVPWLVSAALDGACVSITVTSDAADAFGNEGTTLSTSGSFSHADATITADNTFGTFTDNGDGTWSWSYDAPDQYAQTTITVTATAANGSVASDAFDTRADNVAPTATFNAPESVPAGSTFQITLTDPQDVPADTMSYAFDCGNGTLVNSSPGVFIRTCTAPSTAQTITVRGQIRDEDTGQTTYSDTVEITLQNAAIDPTSHDFGDQPIGTVSDPFTFTVTNDGTADLEITGVDITGSGQSHFDVDNDGCDGETLEPTESCEVDVTFGPSSAGVKTARLTVSSNDPDGDVEADLTGNGTVVGGTIRIVQNTVPDNGKDFFYTGDLGPFTLDDDPNSNPTWPRSMTFSRAPGSYTVTQSPPGTAFPLVALRCNTGESTSLATRSVTITLASNENVVCTFTNGPVRPDALISKTSAAGYVGDNVYSDTVTSAQSRAHSIAPGATKSFFIRIQNDGATNDTISVDGDVTGSSSYTVRFFRNGVDITSGVLSGNHNVNNLAPGAQTTIEARVTAAANTPAGATRIIDLRITSDTDPAKTDIVRGRVTRP